MSGLGVIAGLFLGDWQDYRSGLPVSHDTFFGTAEHLSLFSTRAAAILFIGMAIGWCAAFGRKRIDRRVAAAEDDVVFFFFIMSTSFDQHRFSKFLVLQVGNDPATKYRIVQAVKKWSLDPAA